MNVGIIGFGTMGKIRYNTIKDIPGYSVKKIYDFEKNKELPAGVMPASDYREVLSDRGIDIVFICVPNYLTMKYVVEGLDSGKHVFSEKPPGINSQQVLEMISAEKRNPKAKLMFGFNHRHHESMIFAKGLINSGEYGKVLWLRGRYGKSVPVDFANNWRSKKEFAGGGIFLDQGIHMLDLFLMMCTEFDEVKAYVSNLYWKSDIEDNVFAIFRNKFGQVASLHSTMSQWRHLFALEIFMEKGHIIINGLLTTSGSYGQEQLSVAKNKNAGVSATWEEEKTIIYNTNNSWSREVNTFLSAIKDNTEVPVGSSKDAYNLMVLVDKVYAQND